MKSLALCERNGPIVLLEYDQVFLEYCINLSEMKPYLMQHWFHLKSSLKYRDYFVVKDDELQHFIIKHHKDWLPKMLETSLRTYNRKRVDFLCTHYPGYLVEKTYLLHYYMSFKNFDFVSSYSDTYSASSDSPYFYRFRHYSWKSVIKRVLVHVRMKKMFLWKHEYTQSKAQLLKLCKSVSMRTNSDTSVDTLRLKLDQYISKHMKSLTKGVLNTHCIFSLDPIDSFQANELVVVEQEKKHFVFHIPALKKYLMQNGIKVHVNPYTNLPLHSSTMRKIKCIDSLSHDHPFNNAFEGPEEELKAWTKWHKMPSSLHQAMIMNEMRYNLHMPLHLADTSSPLTNDRFARCCLYFLKNKARRPADVNYFLSRFDHLLKFK